MTLWCDVTGGSPHPKPNGCQRPIPGGACGAKGLGMFAQTPANGLLGCLHFYLMKMDSWTTTQTSPGRIIRVLARMPSQTHPPGRPKGKNPLCVKSILCFRWRAANVRESELESNPLGTAKAICATNNGKAKLPAARSHKMKNPVTPFQSRLCHDPSEAAKLPLHTRPRTQPLKSSQAKPPCTVRFEL